MARSCKGHQKHWELCCTRPSACGLAKSTAPHALLALFSRLLCRSLSLSLSRELLGKGRASAFRLCWFCPACEVQPGNVTSTGIEGASTFYQFGCDAAVVTVVVTVRLRTSCEDSQRAFLEQH